MSRHWGALAALVLASGCGAQDGAQQAGAPTRKDAAPVKAHGRAVLDARGVTFDAPGGMTQEFAWGSSRQQVESVADAVLGLAAIRSTNAECGAGPMDFTQYGPLTLNFQDQKLVGWLAKEGPQVVTRDGISPGKLMRDLRVARSARMVTGSTLPGEFAYLAADGQPIGGFVEGAGREGKIGTLFAGVTCFFR